MINPKDAEIYNENIINALESGISEFVIQIPEA